MTKGLLPILLSAALICLSGAPALSHEPAAVQRPPDLASVTAPAPAAPPAPSLGLEVRE